MQTHDDRDVLDVDKLDMSKLERRADNMVRQSMSEITGGIPGEPILGEWDHDGIRVVHRPGDQQGLLRISVGGGAADINYCAFRGNRNACADLLERAVAAMRNKP